MKDSTLNEKDKSSIKSRGEKQTKDESIGLGNYLKEYLVECDFNKKSTQSLIKEIDEDQDNDDKNSVNLYNNESYLPYLVNLINEKNKFIEELKSSLISLNTKYSESESNYKKEIEKLATEINRKEDKIKVLSEGDKFELIDFYENEIVQITGKYDSLCDIIRASLEGTQTSQGLINEKKNNVRIIVIQDSQKNIINGLLNENSKLNNTVNKLKYLERMSKVYKSLIFRFGNKIELNQK